METLAGLTTAARGGGLDDTAALARSLPPAAWRPNSSAASWR